MRLTFAIADRTSRQATPIKNFHAAWNRLMRWFTEAEARPQMVEETGGGQELDHAIATMHAIYGQDFGARRLAKEISRNRSRQRKTR